MAGQVGTIRDVMMELKSVYSKAVESEDAMDVMSAISMAMTEAACLAYCLVYY